MPKSKQILQEECDSLLRRSNTLAERRQAYLKIYVRSLSERFVSIDYSLNEVRRLSEPTGSTESSNQFQDHDQRRDFYLNCFWAFGYSAFDILAHIINTVHHAVKDESKVSFGRAAHGYDTITPKTFHGKEEIPANILTKLKRTTNKFYFKRLAGYRQCCLHRRAVCLQTQTTRVSFSYADSTSAGGCEHLTSICDDLDDMRPKFTNNTLLDKTCQTIRDGIENDITEILGML